MAEVAVLTIAEGIIASVASEPLKKIRLSLGFKDELRKLERTVTAIKARLLDAEKKQVINNQLKVLLESLEDVIYDADNLVDELRYQQIRRRVVFGKKKAKKVRILLPSSNQLVFRLKMAKKLKQVREMLEEIKSNKVFLELNEQSEETNVPSTMSWRETQSLVNDDQVIGRDNDKNELLELLLEKNFETEESVSMVSLVVIGGLGKTTLAQVVFNNVEVQKCFDKRMWVCVSETFVLRSLLEKIVRSTTKIGLDQNLNLEQLQIKVREEIEGKKYLLVLDDVWNDDSNKWDGLKTFLKLGAKGSKVLITTRSIRVAQITTHSSKIHRLSDLGKNECWALFERVAPEERHYERTEYRGLVEIGKDIVEKCKGVPLAIKTIGRLLLSKTFSSQNLVKEWSNFRDIELSEVDCQSDGDILPTLKLSYNSLSSHLKRCFAYCSLFPKDHRINVQQLVRLWIAQGFIISDSNSRTPEEIGYEYFMILFCGCFFQEAEIDELSSRSIRYCKMHDLMHDLASFVAGMSIKIIDKNVDELEQNTDCTSLDDDQKNVFENVRHVFVDFKSESSCQIPTLLLEQKKMRTFILHEFERLSSSQYDDILSNFKFLRALTLCIDSDVETLPNSLGKLKHLKYLDLSGNNCIKELPNSITSLYNLQTLNVSRCDSLVSLLPDIQNLINLRHLEIGGDLQLDHMPRGIGELTSLQTLDDFLEADDKSSESAGFSELSKLNNLHGDLRIHISGLDESGPLVQYLKEKKHLESLVFWWDAEETMGNTKEAFECAEPHQNIKAIEVCNYPGETFPNWFSLLTNLVRLQIQYCEKCKYLPHLHNLSSLQELKLETLSALEYVSDWDNDCDDLLTSKSFSSLAILEVQECKNLQRWWGREREARQQPFFSQLSELEICECPLLTSMPLYPNLEKLKLFSTSSKSVQQTSMMKLKSDSAAAATSSESSPSSSALSKLGDLHIIDVGDLESLLPETIQNLSSLRSIRISGCSNLASLPEGISNLNSLQKLTISFCHNLASLPEGISNLKSLQMLDITGCDNLTSLLNGIGNLLSLTDLRIKMCNSLTSLSEGIGKLLSLTDLRIETCNNLTSLPEGIDNLSSLTDLKIEKCANLTHFQKG